LQCIVHTYIYALKCYPRRNFLIRDEIIQDCLTCQHSAGANLRGTYGKYTHRQAFPRWNLNPRPSTPETCPLSTVLHPNCATPHPLISWCLYHFISSRGTYLVVLISCCNTCFILSHVMVLVSSPGTHLMVLIFWYLSDLVVLISSSLVVFI
jgi:hypothetical protein